MLVRWVINRIGNSYDPLAIQLTKVDSSGIRLGDSQDFVFHDKEIITFVLRSL